MSELPMWRPSQEGRDATRVMQFARRHALGDYEHLLQKSQDDPSWFWDAVVQDLGIPFLQPYRTVFNDANGPAWATWFEDGQLNLASATVGRWAAATPDAYAVIEEDEGSVHRAMTYGQLWSRVRRLSAGLQRLGVRPGDRVALLLPMSVDAVVASHACAHAGAIQVPLFSGLAPAAVAERLADSDVSVILTVQEHVRKGRPIRLREVTAQATRDLPALRHIVVRSPREPLGPTEVDWSSVEHDEPTSTAAFPSEHPYLLAYTSGTTGRPKGVVHATAGFLVKIASEAAYQTDIGPGDRLAWFTDLGWLMGAWSIVGAHANGATVVMCGGAPTVPPDRVWRTCARHRVTVLGLSPTLVRSLMATPGAPRDHHDLSSLRILASTGEPWDQASYAWFAEQVGGGQLPIINFSGGTEVGACFLSCTPAHPIKPLSVGLPSLGMAVDIVNERGDRVGPGEPGELVCRRPWPGMTRGVWGDPQRYLDAYWTRFPGVWTHGDLTEVDSDGHWFILGRSDDTLNIAGKRVGPAEIESALAGHPGVHEAAVVGVSDPLKGTVAWAFCVPTYADVSDDVEHQLRDLVGASVGRAFVPERIIFVDALPKTRSLKTVRRVLRELASGAEPSSLVGIEEPSIVDTIRQKVLKGRA